MWIENIEFIQVAAKPTLTNGAAKRKAESSSDDSSDSDNASAAKKPKLATNSPKPAATKQASSDSDSDDSDESDNETNKVQPKAVQKLKPSITSTPNFKPVQFVSGGFAKPTIKDDSLNGDTPKQNGKKRKSSESSNSSFTIKNGNNSSLNKSTKSAPNTPFRRVKTEDVHVDARLANNSYEAKVISNRATFSLA